VTCACSAHGHTHGHRSEEGQRRTSPADTACTPQAGKRADTHPRHITSDTSATTAQHSLACHARLVDSPQCSHTHCHTHTLRNSSAK
jgi:hypothetical protein